MSSHSFDLPIGEAIRNMGLYPRASLDSGTVKRLVLAIEAGEELPPIVVNQKSWIIDGFHRWEAHMAAKRPTIAAVKRETTSDAEFFRLAVEMNATHGRPLRGEDFDLIRDRAVKLALEPAVIAAALRVEPLRLAHLSRWIPSTALARQSGHRGRPQGLGTSTSAKAVFYANLLYEALPTTDMDGPGVRGALSRLHEALSAALTEGTP